MKVLTILSEENKFRGEAPLEAASVGFEFGIGKFEYQILSTQDGYGTFFGELDLKPNSTYLIRAFAVDKDLNVHYGKTIKFTTSEDPKYGHAGDPYT
ncbi:MAG: hypothetical protein ACM34K_01730 [Bacillota bacterium]